MNKLHVLLVYGGESSEHEVSIKSAHNVYAALDNDTYDVTLCYIDKVGRWWLTEDIDGAHIGHPRLFPDLGKKSFVAEPGGKVISPDVAFPILHGKNGEDGTVQGLFDLLHIPYVGPSVLAAAVTMDKNMTKRLVRDAGVPVVPWLDWQAHTPMPSFADIRAELGSTVFIKPSRAGSSMGVSRVENASQWRPALRLAAQYDNEILIEQAVSGNEFQVSVMGNDKIQVTSVCEIAMGASFHDFADKYNEDSAAQFFIPARLDAKITEQVRDWALLAYRATGCRGMARVDFLADVKGKMYLNEINSIPGFTNVSVYPKLWAVSGKNYARLIDELISLATEKTYN